ncbi:MAG: hypothetical protein AAGL49_15215, partial [Pseudomonadota bacterium]
MSFSPARAARVHSKRRWRVFSRDARSNRLFLWGLAIAATIFIVDQATKFWILEIVDLDEPAPYGRSIPV